MSEIKVSAGTPSSVAVVRVIRVSCGRGAGIPGDAFRLVTQYWSFDGELLAEHDPVPSAPLDMDALLLPLDSEDDE